MEWTPAQEAKLRALEQCRAALSPGEAALLRELFPHLIKKHHAELWRKFQRRRLDEQEIKDLVQDCLIHLHDEILAKGFPESFPRKMHQIALGKLLNVLRSKRRDRCSLGLPSSRLEKPRSSGIPDLDRELDLRALCERFLPTLSAERREVMEVVIFGGLTHGEAAELLEIDEATLKNRLRLARRELLAKITPFLPPSQRGPQ